MSGDMAGTWFLPRIVGAAKARELYFLPGKFDAAEAARIGLVNRVTPEAAFETELAALVERLANSSPLALKGMKANFVDQEHMGLADFLAAETARHSACGRSEELERGVPGVRGEAQAGLPGAVATPTPRSSRGSPG